MAASQLNSLRENFNQQFEQLKQKMVMLEGAALAPGDNQVPALLSELQQKIDKHDVDIDNIKVRIIIILTSKPSLIH